LPQLERANSRANSEEVQIVSTSRCLTCAHADRNEIERLCAEGEIPTREIAARFHLRKDTVMRHIRRHLPETRAALRKRVVDGMKEAYDTAQTNMRAADRAGKVPQALDGAAVILKIGPQILELIDEEAKAEAPERKKQLIAEILGLSKKLAPSGNPHDVLASFDPATLLAELRPRLRSKPDLRASAAEACAEALSLTFPYGPLGQAEALAAFDAECQALREKFFPAPAAPPEPSAAPPEPPLSAEEKARVLLFGLKVDAW
jgi:hypothetical protein